MLIAFNRTNRNSYAIYQARLFLEAVAEFTIIFLLY